MSDQSSTLLTCSKCNARWELTEEEWRKSEFTCPDCAVVTPITDELYGRYIRRNRSTPPTPPQKQQSELKRSAAILFVVLGIGFVAFQANKMLGAKPQLEHRSPPPLPREVASMPPPAKSPSPGQADAENFAKQVISQYWVPTGNTFLGSFRPMSSPFASPCLIEVKGFLPQVQHDVLSQADGLNGIEWRSTIKVIGAASRIYDTESHTWSNWQEGMHQYDWLDHTVWLYICEKVEGKWKLVSAPNSVRLGIYQSNESGQSAWVNSGIIHQNAPFTVKIKSQGYKFNIFGSKEVRVTGLDAASSKIFDATTATGPLTLPPGISTLQFGAERDPALVIVRFPED